MKTGLSLQELAVEIERQQESKADYVLDTRRMSVVTQTEPHVGTSMWLDGIKDSEGGEAEMQSFKVTDHAHGQIGARLGIPKVFYDRLRNGHRPARGKAVVAQPGVFDTLVNGLFQNAPEKRMVRTLDGKARAVMSNRYRPLDNFDLAQAVLPIISEWSAKEQARVESCQITDTRFYLKVVLPKIEREIRGSAQVGDLVQSGFVIRNSEVGVGSLSVLPMIYRLMCKNGMVREQEGMRKYHVGRAVDEMADAYSVFSDRTLRADDRAFWLKVQDLVKAAANDAVFEQIVARMEQATSSEKIIDPVGAVERIASTFSFGEKTGKSILAHLIEGGDLSAYGAMNAITRASQDVADYDLASDMEVAGGKLLDLPKAAWREIAGVT